MMYIPYKDQSRFTLSQLGEPISPPRYLYHLDYSGGKYYNESEKLLLKRLNIAKEGLYGKDKGFGGVWANKYQANPYWWFPICLDYWDYLGDKLKKELLIGYYDVWRIDTHKIKNEWYQDGNMQRGEMHDISKSVYTPDTVPGRALQLFHMELDKDVLYDYNDHRIKEFVPVKKINDYIRCIHRRKRKYFMK